MRKILEKMKEFVRWLNTGKDTLVGRWRQRKFHQEEFLLRKQIILEITLNKLLAFNKRMLKMITQLEKRIEKLEEEG